MVLLFIYLDRVVHMFRVVKRAFPTMSTWTRKAISGRVASELKDGFGKGRVDERLTVVLEDATKVESMNPEPELMDQGEDESKEDVEEDNDVNNLNKLADAAADDRMEDGEEDSDVNKLAEAADDERKDDVEEENVVNKLAKAALEFACSYSRLKDALREARVAEPTDSFVLQMGSFVEHVSEVYNEHCKSADAIHPNAEFGISDSQLNKVIGELEQRFGPLPEEDLNSEGDPHDCVVPERPTPETVVPVVLSPTRETVVPVVLTPTPKPDEPVVDRAVGDAVMNDAPGVSSSSPRQEAEQASDALLDSDEIFIAAAVEAERVYLKRLDEAVVHPVQTETKKKKRKHKTEIDADIPSFKLLGSELDST